MDSFQNRVYFLTVNIRAVSVCTSKKSRDHVKIQMMAMNGTYAYQMLSRSECVTLKQKMKCKRFSKNKNKKLRLIEAKKTKFGQIIHER